MSVNDCLNNDNKGGVNFKSSKSILNAILNLFKVPPTTSSRMPLPLILAGKAKPGLSPTQIASRIIKRQSEAGLNVGPLPSGLTNPAEVMETIRVEEMVKALVTEANVAVAIQPGSLLQATGGNAGGPIQVFGTVIGLGEGSAQIT